LDGGFSHAGSNSSALPKRWTKVTAKCLVWSTAFGEGAAGIAGIHHAAGLEQHLASRSAKSLCSTSLGTT
jgi:hypothetical protein